MTTNKHMMIAMIVAPILAIISYFATDYMVSDVPVAAEAGESYALLPRSNCRYQSGNCTLRNGDIEINLRMVELAQGKLALEAKSNQPVEGMKVALTQSGQVDQPATLTKLDKEGQHWAMPIQNKPAEDVEMRVATVIDGTTFYASSGTTFFEYDTIFPRSAW